MKTKKHITVCGNTAVARIAYKTNEVCAIYPITPSSKMSELVEQWSATKQENIFDTIPSVFEMQSEAGVAGAMHGALQTGTLSTTFTASQGLLLMLPNMYKIAGELTPNVIHVATRSISTHALSVFGDHSDIMAVRSSGYAILGSASVQEAQDFALISQAATLQSRIPFIHFFDGFRTSHETSKIEEISDSIINEMMDFECIQNHRNRALNPNNPVIRGTAQGAEVFFQSREAVNPYYNSCPDIVQNKMDAFAELTGRHYKIFDYVGAKNAEYIIISMASSTETVEETINYLNANGEKYGLIKVRLFRPFSKKHIIKALPETVKSIAVLDRTKEPGATGEPLYLDVVQSIFEAFQNKEISIFPKIVGGRYGLSSKEFTPNMVKSVFNNLKSLQPKNNFTIGIFDDLTNLSLSYAEEFKINIETYQALFYQHQSLNNKNKFNCVSELIGNTTEQYVQSYSEGDYKKSESRNVMHLRLDSKPIKAPYLINNADFIVCQNVYFIVNDNVLKNIRQNGTLLVATSLRTNAFWQTLPVAIQEQIIKKEITLIIVDSNNLKESYNIEKHSISSLQACFLALINELTENSTLAEIKKQFIKVDTSIQTNFDTISIEDDKDFTTTLLGKLLANNGNKVSVSELPVDGTYPTNTSVYNPNTNTTTIPKWNPNSCTQCGACSMACPQSAIRMKVFEDENLEEVPQGFKSVISNDFDLMNFTIQVNSNQCNACNNCIDACSEKALFMADKSDLNNEYWRYFDTLPKLDRTIIDTSKVSQQQLQEPLFEYSNGDDGCGEAPYFKLLSQLFGDRLLIANATGSSSIFGAALPTTPWAKNKAGKGPVWSNSLFEDNAEFGLGFRLSLDQQEYEARTLLKKMMQFLDFDLVHDIISAKQHSEIEIIKQQNRVTQLKEILNKIKTSDADELNRCADALVKKSVWCVGGDGWAYDIGFGGLDHVIASGKNVNILILDNEVYSNTGGQMSKATPFGASAKFAHLGKAKQKKDLGLMAMTYEDVYVASVAMGANQEQTLKAFKEAESFDGPSVIIAYCHSNSHGIDMRNPSQYHKAAVASGQWLLYRNDPRKLKSFQLDSNQPTLKIEDYLKMEKRFDRLLKSTNNQLINKLQINIDKRFQKYKSLSYS